MEQQMFTRYGMMFECDCDVFDDCLGELVKDKPGGVIRVCEIGTYNGDTARGMKRFLESHGCGIEYWGIDPGLVLHNVPLPEPFPGAHIITDKSDFSFHLIPNDMDLVFVDGNHSRNSVILDTYNYERKVVRGGFMLFHDTNPASQGTGYEYEGPQIPEFGIAVREAWAMIEWPWDGWSLFMEKFPDGHHQNGTTAFRRN